MKLRTIFLASLSAMILASGATAAWVLKDWAWCPGCSYSGSTAEFNLEVATNNALQLPNGFQIDGESAGKKSGTSALGEFLLKDGSLVLVRVGREALAKDESTKPTRRVIQVATWSPSQTELVGSTIYWPEAIIGRIQFSVEPVTGTLLLVASTGCGAAVLKPDSNGRYGATMERSPGASDRMCLGKMHWDVGQPGTAYVETAFAAKDEPRSDRYTIVSNGPAVLAPNLNVAMKSVLDQVVGVDRKNATPILQYFVNGRYHYVLSARSPDAAVASGPGSQERGPELNFVAVAGTCDLVTANCERNATSRKLQLQESKQPGYALEILVEGIGSVMRFKDPAEAGIAATNILQGFIFNLDDSYLLESNFAFLGEQNPLRDVSKLGFIRKQPYEDSRLPNPSTIKAAFERLAPAYETSKSRSPNAMRENQAGVEPTEYSALDGYFGGGASSKAGLIAAVEKNSQFKQIPQDTFPVGNLVCVDDRAQTFRRIETKAPDSDGVIQTVTKELITPQSVKALTTMPTAIIRTKSSLAGAPTRLILLPVQSQIPQEPSEAVSRIMSAPTIRIVQATTADALCD